MTTEPPHSGLPFGIATSAPSRTPLWRGFRAWSASSAMLLCRSNRKSSALDGGAHQVAPLGPGPVVVSDLVVAQEVGQDEPGVRRRSEEHTSELQSRQYLVCRLLLEKKK